MKAFVSDWLLAPKPEPDAPNSPSSSVFTSLHPETKLLSNERELLLLTQLYLELSLSLEQAQCAARADILAAKAQPTVYGRSCVGKAISNQ